MLGFATLLFIVSPIAFLAGLVNPKWVLLGQNRTRIKSSAIYSGVFVASLVVAGMAEPPQAKQGNQPSPQLAKQTNAPSPSPELKAETPKPQSKEVATEAKNWSDELCQGDRYFPVNGASVAQFNGCQYIKSDSLKPETIVLATDKDSENVADAMVAQGFKKVSLQDDFNPLTDQSTSACIVYVDKSVTCHKGEGDNPNSTDTRESKAETTSSTSTANVQSVPESASEAILIASDPDSQINLREAPSASGKRLGYGLVGDQVKLLKQTTAESSTWYEVKFPNSGAIGWIHGDFISSSSADETSQPAPESTPASNPEVTYSAPTVSASSGKCNFPDDLDARGRRCGKRAASVRPGGN